MKLDVTHTIAVNAEKLWNFYHSPQYEAYYPSRIGLQAYEVIETKETDQYVYRRVRVVPQIPSAAQSLVNKVLKMNGIAYEETQKRYKDPKRMWLEWGTLLPMVQDKIHIEGTLEFVPVDDRSCKRILRGDVQVKVFGVGGQIEKMIISGVTDTYEKMARIAEQYARENGLA